MNSDVGADPGPPDRMVQEPDVNRAVRDHGSGRHLKLCPLRRWMDPFRDRQRAGRVFPLPISIAIILGGLAGFRALLAPWGILLGVALVMLGIWIVRTGGRRAVATVES
jgi:hypothetical protein